MNLTLNEKYFFEQCREPRLYFIYTYGQNLLLRLLALLLAIYYILSGYYFWKNRNLIRLKVRFNAVFLTGLIIFPLKLFAAYIYSVGEPYFFNICIFDKLTFTLTQLLLVLPMGSRIYLFFLEYKLHKVVCYVPDSSSKKTKIDQIKEKFSSNGVNKLAMKVFVLSFILSVTASLVFCPIFERISICGNYGIGKQIYTLMSSMVVAYLIITVCLSIYYTLKYPDPYGILIEAVGVNVFYVIILYTYLKGVRDLNGPLGTSYYFGSVLIHVCLGLLFTIMIPMQVYLGKRYKNIAFTLNQTMHHPNALKTFRMFTERIMTVEHLNFYIEAVKFREEFSADIELSQTKARDIYTKYIAAEAHNRINLSDNELSPFLELFDKKSEPVKKDIFDSLIKGVFRLLELDSYARFLESDLYNYNLYSGKYVLKPGIKKVSATH